MDRLPRKQLVKYHFTQMMDVLLYLTYPQKSVSILLDKINLFGTFAGYRINWTKSILMPVYIDDMTSLTNFPFQISLEKLT